MDSVDWNGGLEWNGMEWPDKLCNCGHVRPLTLKLGYSHRLEQAEKEATGCLDCFILFANSEDLCL